MIQNKNLQDRVSLEASSYSHHAGMKLAGELELDDEDYRRDKFEI